MAAVLASFLISNGATDTRFQSKDQPKNGSGQGRQGSPGPTLTDWGITPQDGGPRHGRDAKRLARPGQPPDAARPADGPTPVQAATDSKTGGQAEARQARQTCH